MTRFADIADLPEDDRIDVIGRRVTDLGERVAFIVDSDPGKADRYIAKLQARWPSVIVLDRGPGPVANTVTVRVGRDPLWGRRN